MQWLVNLPTRRKLVFFFGFIVLLNLILIGTGSFLLRSITESQRRLYTNDMKILLNLMEVDKLFHQNRAEVLKEVLGKREFQSLSQELEKRVETVLKLLTEVDALLRDRPALQKQFEQYRSIYDAYATTRRDVVMPALQAGKTQEALALINGIQADRHQRIADLSRRIMEEASATAREQVASSLSAARTATLFFLSLGLLVIVFSIWSASYLTRIITTPLMAISRYSEQIAGGDLTVTVRREDRGDELGMLSRSFETMVSGLRDLNREVAEGVSSLWEAGAKIFSATSEMATGVSQTASAVKETAVTLEEVKQTTHLATEKAQHVSDMAQKAVQAARSGRGAVEDTVQGMRQIMRQMESVTESIVRLSDQTQAISEIIASVGDLAEQSNLLAVNAAIEAAKAGENGKGFSVVAQEVRHLASQSKQATAEIRGLLSEIQKATSTSVMATEQGSKVVEAGMEQANRAGDSIRVLAEAVDEAASAAMQIAASSKEQLVGMDQISMAMNNIRTATDQHVTGTRQTEDEARRINDIGNRLREAAARFKI